MDFGLYFRLVSLDFGREFSEFVFLINFLGDFFLVSLASSLVISLISFGCVLFMLI